MKRTSSQLLSSILTLCVATGAVVLSTANAWADAAMAFGPRPSYSENTNAPPGTVLGSGTIFVYNLLAPGSNNPSSGAALPNDPRYVGPVNTTFDIYAKVGTPGTHDAAAFGLILNLGGGGEVTFNVPPIDSGDAPPNNILYSANGDFTSQTNFDLMFGTTGVQGGGTRELDLIGAHGTAGANVTVTDGNGLAAVPTRVQPTAAGSYPLAFSLPPTYTGFVDSDLVVHTDPTLFPHTGGSISVRESRPGDMNGDGAVDGEDIDGFLAAFEDVDGFQAQYPWIRALYIADFNADGAVDGEDIDGFLVAFENGSPAAAGPAAIPEPSAIVLAVLGAAGLGIARLRRRRK